MNEDKKKQTPQFKSTILGSNTLPQRLAFEAVPKPSVKSRKKSIDPNLPDYSKMPPSNKVNNSLMVIIAIVLVGFLSGCLGAYYWSGRNEKLSTAKEIVTSQSQVVSAIAKDVNPSVVSIHAQSNATTQDIFGNTTTSPQESAGTGIIISNNGYIVTNRHVISGATNVSVTLSDGTTIKDVQVIGVTGATDTLDIGFLKINNPPEALQPALLGNSSKVQVGDNVVAIGDALGQFENTVTSGIISGRGRTIQAGDQGATTNEDLQDLFQTDAAINPGNSGGPLININGEVIGINTALASNGAQNIGFSIPINDVEGLIKGVLATGTIKRPYIGVYYVIITPAVVKKYNLSVNSGAFIPPDKNGQSSIISSGPASHAGLQTGDVIKEINGVEVNSNNTLSTLIDQHQVGDSVTLIIIRNGNQKDIQVTVGQLPTPNQN
jgi:S1-C subfamily serine protease